MNDTKQRFSFSKYLAERNHIIIILILIFGLILRCQNTKMGVPSPENYYTYIQPDEGTWGWRSGMIFTINKIKVYEGNFFPGAWGLIPGGFYPVFMSFIMDTLGVKRGINDINALRYPETCRIWTDQVAFFKKINLLMSLIIVFVVYKIAKLLFNKKVGLLSAFLMAASYTQITTAHFLKEDILVMLLVCLVLLFSIKIYKFGKPKYYYLAGFFAGLSAATKYINVVSFFFVITAVLLVIDWKDTQNTKLKIKYLFFSGLFAVLGFIIGCPSVITHTPVIIERFMYLVSYSHYILIDTMREKFKFLRELKVLNFNLGFPIFITFIISFLYTLFNFKKNRENILVLSFFIPLFLLSFNDPSGLSRYLMPVTPFCVMLISKFLIEDFRILIPEKLKSLGGMMIIFFVAYYFIFSIAHIDIYAKKETRLVAKDWIEANIPPDKSILIFRQSGDEYGAYPAIFSQFMQTRNNVIDFQIFITNYKFPDLSKKQVDYYIVSDVIYLNYLKPGADFSIQTNPQVRKRWEENNNFIYNLRNGTNYFLVKKFESGPTIFGIKFKKGWTPPDMLQNLPDIEIYQKKS